ncbi:hypothetical protein [Ruminococcus flavefaciens]|uniref:hypothetical protein n=1 Tax=Ruminococcus flavefaciens TaxID=1265 RepID=UPI00048A5109|nr:hypothetical protein [Ruminococcus flavefaciens]
MIRFVHKKISWLISFVRTWLNRIRSKKPDAFDKSVKVVTFFIPFLSCFAPALVTNNWLRACLEFLVLSLILVFQWSALTNRVIAKNNELKQANSRIKEYEEKIANCEARIKNLERDTVDYTDWIGEDEKKYKARLTEINCRFDELAGFSHIVSDRVKKITAEIEKPVDPRVVKKMTDFLQQSLSSLEKLLSEHYGHEIRSSIKIMISNDKLKTYARGHNNIISRGGEYHCSQLNVREIEIADNYAYTAIVQHEQQFFAEGNLIEMHNKFDRDDVFFCEYGDEYTNYFYSTIVMPIRVPVFASEYDDNSERTQEVMGMLCVDCLKELPEWSDNNLRNKRAYHIIADYADSLAILVKEFKNAIQT